MFRPMTPVAKRETVRNVPPQIRVILERLDVVRVEFDARSAAMLAGCLIAADYVRRPLVLLGRAVRMTALPVGVLVSRGIAS